MTEKQIPYKTGIAGVLNAIHESGRFSNKRHGEKIGLSDASISNYRNLKRPEIPHVDDIYSLLDMIDEAPEIPDSERLALSTQLKDAVSKYIEANGTEKLELNGSRIFAPNNNRR